MRAISILRRLAVVSVTVSLGLLVGVSVVAQETSPTPSESPVPSPTASMFLPTLEARPEGAFDVLAFDGWAEGLVEPRPNTTLTVDLLEGGRLEGQTGCGTYFGAYTIDGDDLALGIVSKGPDPCGTKRTEEAVAFSVALAAVSSWVPTPTGIELLDEQGVVRVVLDRPDPAGLAGEWIIERVARSGGGLVAAPQDSVVVIRFDEGGGVDGNTGCRSFEGTYSREADRVAIGPVETLGLPCDGDLHRQERRLLNALDSTILWQRVGDALLLTDGKGMPLVELVEGDDASGE